MPVAQDNMIYRSNDAVIGGVCAGIAKHFEIDPNVIRAFFVMLGVVTAGAMVLFYLALWFIVPLDSDAPETVDIEVEAFESDNYGQVVSAPCKQASESPAVTSVHIPPPAPPAAQRAEDAPGVAFAPTVGQVDYTEGAGTRREPAGASIVIALAVGLVIASFGMACLFTSFTQRFDVIQFWPLIIVCMGIARMVIPSREGTHANVMLVGAIAVFAGVLLLLVTLEIIAIEWQPWLLHGMPFLLIALGLWALGHGLKSGPTLVGAIFAFSLFCLTGAMFYIHAGPSYDVRFGMPAQERIIIEWDDQR